MERIEVRKDLVVGSQPENDDLDELSDEGFATIMNLRAPAEDGDTTSARDEGVKARTLGMMYVNMPVPMNDLSTQQVNDFRAKLNLLPKPVFVHCSSGKRAGTLALINEAIDQGWSAEDTLSRGRQLGVGCDEPPLRELVQSAVAEKDEASS
ncbi:Beta-lactamase hydrolase-like protein [Maioricimonas rarisocia]|uniref:Beta-lactamase hydrolase-like protein n=1 Tax=Maioricimonas rarisocia TaxID=2528026 RepID=A0A517Z6R7_9PLAN|nr:sulfur transferase domain-containing protein [Maioricimonas rarisocia]QDU38190.1 Beta-lactamase hydrolase-like protein [Maioricimonas rarisocia]